jgi:hypothetical protein
VLEGCGISDATIPAFKSIVIVDGSAKVQGSSALSNMSGFRGLVYVEGDLILKDNSGLSSLDGIGGQKLVVGGNLVVQNNVNLHSIQALQGVTVGGRCGWVGSLSSTASPHMPQRERERAGIHLMSNV